jgi:LytS/YehU family sensor histidine kinase
MLMGRRLALAVLVLCHELTRAQTQLDKHFMLNSIND